jgi:hypothetical protein
MAVESLAAVEVLVSVVWLLLHEASRPRAATGAAQRAEALFQKGNINAECKDVESALTRQLFNLLQTC